MLHKNRHHRCMYMASIHRRCVLSGVTLVSPWKKNLYRATKSAFGSPTRTCPRPTTLTLWSATNWNLMWTRWHRAKRTRCVCWLSATVVMVVCPVQPWTSKWVSYKKKTEYTYVSIPERWGLEDCNFNEYEISNFQGTNILMIIKLKAFITIIQQFLLLYNI